EQRRAASAARQAGAGGAHQARALEVAHDGRYRRRGEPGAAGQLGARDLALAPDEVEQERAVARAHALCVDGRLLDVTGHECVSSLVPRPRNSLEFDRASAPIASLLLPQIRRVFSVVAPRALAGGALS